MDWADAGGGLVVALSAAPLSAADAPLMVSLHFRNVGSEALILKANETSADDPKLPAALSQCPLYALDGIEVAPASTSPQFKRWSPVPSQMFMLDKWVQLAPGATLTQVARFDTPFWECGPRRAPWFPAGVHVLRAVMSSRAPSEEHVEKLKAFLAGPSRNDVMAFWDVGVSLSLGEAFQLEKWGWAFWRGSVTTKPVIVERS
jgi:hypothetical protein